MPARSISPVPYRGTLYIFWDERQSQAKTGVSQGTSTSSGYTNKVTVRYASLKVDGTWTPPQRLTNWRYQGPTYQRDIAEEFPRGSHWERVFPDVVTVDGSPRLYIVGAGSGGDVVDTFRNTVWGAWWDPAYEKGLRSATRLMGLNQWGLDIRLAESDVLDMGSSGGLYYQATDLLRQTVKTPLKKLLSAKRAPDTEIVNGSHLNCVVTVDDDTLLLHDVPAGYCLRRLGTTASETMAQRLATGTLGQLLSLDFQERLTERAGTGHLPRHAREGQDLRQRSQVPAARRFERVSARGLRRSVRGLLPRGLLPHSIPRRQPPQRPAALRRRAALVPLHLRPDEQRRRRRPCLAVPGVPGTNARDASKDADGPRCARGVPAGPVQPARDRPHAPRARTRRRS